MKSVGFRFQAILKTLKGFNLNTAILNVVFIVQPLSGLKATRIFLPRISFGAIRVYPFQGFFDPYHKVVNSVI